MDGETAKKMEPIAVWLFLQQILIKTSAFHESKSKKSRKINKK